MGAQHNPVAKHLPGGSVSDTASSLAGLVGAGVWAWRADKADCSWMATVERGWGAGEKNLRVRGEDREEGAGGAPPALSTSCGELELAGVSHGRFDGIDQRRGSVMNGGHANAERLRIVQPAGDVVDGAERQVQTEPRADGGGDRLGDDFADIPGDLGGGDVHHRVILQTVVARRVIEPEVAVAASAGAERPGW